MAHHVIDISGEDGFQVKQVTLRIGKELKKGEKSRSGLYAIRARRKNLTLRVSLYQEVAEYLCDYDSRYLAECWLVEKKE